MMSTRQHLDRVRELIQRDAITTGQFLDRQEQHLRSLETADLPPAQPQLAARKPIPFAPASRRLTKQWINTLYRNQKHLFAKGTFTGITAAKQLPAAKFADWLTERGLDVRACFQTALGFPTPDQLLTFWLNHGSPQLPKS